MDVPNHFTRLASAPRPAGSAAVREARDYCASVLRALGYVVKEHSFQYSKFPGAWAAPVLGALAAAYLAAAASATSCGSPIAGMARCHSSLAVAALAVLLAAAVGLAASRGVLTLPIARAAGVNLQAACGDEPRVWLVAHLDSKWQPVPMLARVAGVVLVTVGVAGCTMALGGALLGDPLPPALVLAACVVGWIGTAPLLLSVVGHRNDGALDNASGVAAVLEAAELLGGAPSVGVLLTDAEEFALAGARAWLAASPARAASVALNCDSIDDHGPYTVLYGGARTARVIEAVIAAAEREVQPARAMRMPPGILADSVAFAAARWQTLTLSRGTIRTLRRIHTRRDSLVAMSGSGISGAARLLADAARTLATETR